VDFLDDYPTDISRALQNGSETLYYHIDSDLCELTHQWIREAMAELDRIIAVEVKEKLGIPIIQFVRDDRTGAAGRASTSGEVKLPGNIAANKSGGHYRGPRTIRHEIGHVLGLSHPGKDPDGKRPDDWNVGGELNDIPNDGQNLYSDESVVRPDGKTPLDGRDTLMAFSVYSSVYADPHYRWMDVMVLRQMYGVNEALPWVLHFDTTNGTCD
jgi:hypothetical protein